MENEAALPGPEDALVGSILGGPDDTIFEDIFDWIWGAAQSVISSVVSWINRAWSDLQRTVTSWVSWGVNLVVDWIRAVENWILNARSFIIDQVTRLISGIWSWIVDQATRVIETVGALIRGGFRTLESWLSDLWGDVNTLLTNITGDITAGFAALGDRLQGYFDWLEGFIRTELVDTLDAWWGGFLDRILDFGTWIDRLLDAIADWFLEDVPGHSPRWLAIFETIGEWLYRFFMRPKELEEAPIQDQFMYSFNKLFGWIGDTFNTVFEGFSDAIISFARQLGPMSPGVAVDNYASIAKVGAAALVGLAGMTLAGSWLKPLGGAGMGNIAAMIYDMTNYKLITGAFMGAMTVSMLRTPLTYYFNDLFRPWLISQRDFTELLSRRAFTEPEVLQNKELTTAVAELTGGDGEGFEKALIGFYGYPAPYHGLFRELANTRLGYFALAGVARTGFYDEAWFREALARTGYSETARTQLLAMYREMVLMARQGPAMSQLSRQAREGFMDLTEIQVHLDRVAGFATLTEARAYGMELEKDYAIKSMALDINLRAFSRGVISESACRSGLARLIKAPDLVNLHLAREKLGLIRRITLAEPEVAAAPEYIEGLE